MKWISDTVSVWGGQLPCPRLGNWGLRFLIVSILGSGFIPLSSAAQADQSPSTEDHQDLDALRVSLLAFLNSIKNLTATFHEVSTKRQARGGVMLERPPKGFGHLKFVYDPPLMLEVVSTEGRVYSHQIKAQSVDSTPLESTPLFMLLRPTVELVDPVDEKKLRTEGHFVYWTLGQTDTTEGMGPEVTLIFQRRTDATEAWALYGWDIRDLQDHLTEVRLENVVLNKTNFPPHTFRIPEEKS